MRVPSKGSLKGKILTIDTESQNKLNGIEIMKFSVLELLESPLGGYHLNYSFRSWEVQSNDIFRSKIVSVGKKLFHVFDKISPKGPREIGNI